MDWFLYDNSLRHERVYLIDYFSNLTQNYYKRRRDKVSPNIPWKICKKYAINDSEKWEQH